MVCCHCKKKLILKTCFCFLLQNITKHGSKSLYIFKKEGDKSCVDPFNSKIHKSIKIQTKLLLQYTYYKLHIRTHNYSKYYLIIHCKFDVKVLKLYCIFSEFLKLDFHDNPSQRCATLKYILTLAALESHPYYS